MLLGYSGVTKVTTFAPAHLPDAASGAGSSFGESGCVSGAALAIAKVTLPAKKRAVSRVFGQLNGYPFVGSLPPLPEQETLIEMKSVATRHDGLIIGFLRPLEL